MTFEGYAEHIWREASRPWSRASAHARSAAARRSERSVSGRSAIGDPGAQPCAANMKSPAADTDREIPAGRSSDASGEAPDLTMDRLRRRRYRAARARMSRSGVRSTVF